MKTDIERISITIAVRRISIALTIVSAIAILVALNNQDIQRNTREQVSPTLIYFLLLGIQCVFLIVLLFAKAVPQLQKIFASISAASTTAALCEGTVFSERYFNHLSGTYQYYRYDETVSLFNGIWVFSSLAVFLIQLPLVLRSIKSSWRLYKTLGNRYFMAKNLICFLSPFLIIGIPLVCYLNKVSLDLYFACLLATVAVFSAYKINGLRKKRQFLQNATNAGMTPFQYAKKNTLQPIIDYCEGHLDQPADHIEEYLNCMVHTKALERCYADALIDGYISKIYSRPPMTNPTYHDNKEDLKTSMIKYRYICDLLWRTAFNYLKATNQEASLIKLSYYWGTLFFSIHDILDKHSLTGGIQKEFVHSAVDMLRIPMDDVETLAALKGMQKNAYQTLADSGYSPSSRDSLYLSLELASYIETQEGNEMGPDVNPRHMAEYMMSVADLTKDVSAYLSHPTVTPVHVSNSSTSTVSTEAPESDKSFLWKKKTLILLAVFVVLVLVIVLSDSSDGESLSDDSTSHSPTEEKLIAQSRPRNGQILEEPSTERVAPLTVNTSSKSDYYIFLQHVSRKSRSMAFYVRGGSTVEIDVPLGEYEIFYATGSTWYGSEHLFGSDTAYYKCEDTFLFNYLNDQYNGWTLTLYAVPNGNMDTERIDSDDFPQ